MSKTFDIVLLLACLTFAPILALRFDSQQVLYNLNQNQTAVNPLDYWGQWENHNYNPSPSNWRFPFYSLFLDRFVNGDPSNDDINGTTFEHDPTSTQLRHGGDLAGLVDSLDYIQGMGVKAIYIAGTPFINNPWESDGYSPLDLTLLDAHYGNITEWQAAIDEIHRRGMYVVLDNTISTLGDLVGFEGFLNTTTTFSPAEHKAAWKSSRRYHDFSFNNVYNTTCAYPRFWNQSGQQVLKGSDPVFDQLTGCYDSEFDQYGDTEAFGSFPDWQRELSKFASVQDRLREWDPEVRSKLERFSCMTIAMLDIDGYRFDKATQVTVDAQAQFTQYLRQCAKQFGKENFFMAGEITGSDSFGAIYLGRGREPEMRPADIATALNVTSSSQDVFLRDEGLNALDGAAFHYSIYRSLTKFLGMDGNITIAYDIPLNWVDAWNTFLTTNDFVNANTGELDPRHMYGVTNQDVFRWPAIQNGTEKMLLGLFITTLHMPGIPLLLWGEEQAFYILDGTANNYVFGRQAMSSTTAWQDHGCYTLGSSQYYNFPVEAATKGCLDDSVSLDHRDPSHPVRNIIKSLYRLREDYTALNDGYFLQSLSNMTRQIVLPGSNGTSTELGVWSVVRDYYPGVQIPIADTENDGSVWFVYQNEDHQVDYSFDCSSNDTALIAPFPENTTVKNLMAPYDELQLQTGPTKLFLHGSQDPNGCAANLTLKPWEFKAYVPIERWTPPPPMLTRFVPGHDARIMAASDGNTTVNIEFHFSEPMDCDYITQNIFFNSTSEAQSNLSVDNSTVSCGNITDADQGRFIGELPSTWAWTGKLTSVPSGVHTVSLPKIPTVNGDRNTGSTDRLMFRVGTSDNPIVFPRTGNYSDSVLSKDSNGSLVVTHKAAGADKWRYSTNWQSSWSDWADYQGGNSTLVEQSWSGTKAQRWSGDHVVLQYWNRMTGSSDYIQHADLPKQTQRRFPHLFAHGPFNQFGFDAGLNPNFQLDNGTWNFHLITEWPSILQVNVWGMNPDGQPDQTFAYGDIDNDFVLDRLSPGFLGQTVVNMSEAPPSPHLAYRLEIDDGNLRYKLVPAGSRLVQVLIFALLWSIPVVTGAMSIWTYINAFYAVKFNKNGNAQKRKRIPFLFRNKFQKLPAQDDERMLTPLQQLTPPGTASGAIPIISLNARRTILVATMEYDIEDWKIKIKIGGLGVMAQLMGKSLTQHDLIWVVPCVGDVDYPTDQPAQPMTVQILGKPYMVKVQYHKLQNITYVLLDAPVFRAQTKSDPYPPRMDDLDSAVYYSAWNACIAETIKRFPIDIYHINDYHGAAAPLYLLPRTIPVCLSLHNAEFQGLWPMRTPKESDEVSKVYNLDPSVIKRYVQFGEVFNLLHAGASYLRIHQKGFGAVGVSNKYGSRSYARYPIFWGLKEIGKLPNPDPSDTDPWDRNAEETQVISVDREYEASRGDLRRQAQEWAHLDVDPEAELFVFVGRWSNQKGVDLIADVFPAVLEKHSKVQLICIGPVIDLYGKFAALKLDIMMKKYPGRVYSKPEFTALPPFIFTGAEFALIPSRDEPFGLVAVEFGRKGALGVGARVGGLGQMPGWWYTVESTTTKHLQRQFKSAIEDALASKTEQRALMRAKSAKQRFPVARWVEDLDILQSTAIRVSREEAASGRSRFRSSSVNASTTSLIGHLRGNSTERFTLLDDASAQAQENVASTQSTERSATGLNRTLSLGVRVGPGHRPSRAANQSGRLDGTAEAAEENDNRDSQDHAVREEYYLSPEDAEQIIRDEERARTFRQLESGSSPYASPARSDDTLVPHRAERGSRGLSPIPRALRYSRSPDDVERSGSPSLNDSLLRMRSRRHNRNSSALDLNEIKRGRTDYSLQMIDPTFNDTTGEFYKSFESILQKLDGKNSEKDLCIEDYLVQSEKEWFKRFRQAKLNRSRNSSPVPSGSRVPSRARTPSGIRTPSRPGTPSRFETPSSSDTALSLRRASPRPSTSASPNLSALASPDPAMRATFAPSVDDLSRQSSVYDPFRDDSFDSDRDLDDTGLLADEFLLGKDYVRPSFVKRLLQRRIGDWPVYSLFLALGQIMAANSYQITLLTGGQSQTPERLYIIGGIYIFTSCIWWIVFRSFKSRYVLSVPFLLYALAFMFVGVAPFVHGSGGRSAMQNVATALYATASSSGSLFFALNFGDEGGAPIKSWVLRACLIQGTQQIYITALFYWGSTLTAAMSSGQAMSSIVDSPRMAAAALPIAAFLLAISVILFTSLPPYYNQTPGSIPSFYKTLWRRKLIPWFFVTITLQNYFLSAPYGRNWNYLWSSMYAPNWAVVILVLTFFVLIWAIFLAILGKLSTNHSWVLPIFAIGLGAPRWCQMLWGTSGIGLWLPWMPGGPVAGALAGRSLWLWLGLLDSIQGVGFGMMLLQTLTRIHIAWTLMAAQILGTAVTMIARASSPDREGPGDVFPDFSAGIVQGLSKPWFWIALVCQLVIPIGFFKFFRKEQLSKP